MCSSFNGGKIKHNQNRFKALFIRVLSITKALNNKTLMFIYTVEVNVAASWRTFQLQPQNKRNLLSKSFLYFPKKNVA